MSEVDTQGSFFKTNENADNNIVIMARDPHCLFAHWDISDERKSNFIKTFGHELWEKSVPVLKIKNVSENTSFFVRINDFSNSWYINVSNANCIYGAEIGRRISDQFFVNFASSNYVSTPGECMSSNATAHFINYKSLKNGTLDVETGNIIQKYSTVQELGKTIGISSPELMGARDRQSFSGISSAELIKANISERFGVSSEAFIKQPAKGF